MARTLGRTDSGWHDDRVRGSAPGTRFVSAQTNWQCKSWTLEKQEDAAAVGTWLGQARNAEMAAAGLSVGGALPRVGVQSVTA